MLVLSLRDLIISNLPILQLNIKLISYSLINAVQEFHTICRIRHSDISPENILINDLTSFKLVLCDFNYCDCLDACRAEYSPLDLYNYENDEFYLSFDLESIGYVILEILCNGYLPWDGIDSMDYDRLYRSKCKFKSNEKRF